MSSNPPSRIPPHSPDTKSVRDDLTSKGKVEKVREVDADETRKKFRQYIEEPTLEEEEEKKPSIFEAALKKEALPHSEKFWVDQEKEKIEIVPIVVPHPVYARVEVETQEIKQILRPEIHEIFTHMVSTITVMCEKSGVITTEIVLDNPKFEKSRFFGSTIVIEKYSTAPDALNIRLTGTNEAVQTFVENRASLMEAFQVGNFSFTINRIDAEYRPLIRRKEKSREKGDKR